MNSPFQYGTLATADNFVDRIDDRNQLKNYLLSHVNVMLVSPRRWGKSSLVKKTMEELIAENKNVRVCFIDAFSIATEAEFYRTFASQVIACTSSKFEKRVRDAKKFLSGVVPQLVIKNEISDFMAFDVRYVPKEQEKMDILQLPEKIATEKNIQIIVCIDEFQQLAGLKEYKNMEGKMRAAWQQQEHVSYCLYGSKRHMMMDIFNNSNSPFYRFGQMLFMGKIDKREWMPFIKNSFLKTSKKISDYYAEKICDIVECHSWYIQQLCYFIWNATDDTVDEDTFNYGIKQLINTNAPMFQNDTDSLSSSQIELLRAIKDGVQQLSAATTKRLYNLGNPNTISKNKKILVNKDIVEFVNRQFQFVDPIYKLWLCHTY